ncbi:MAG: hypothetical protein LIO59_03160 [Oscillospiraceae bacterium]|nr:hypothetical protein [Oscillospiraceae bacterium]
MGMIAASYIAVKRGLISEDTLNEIEDILQMYGFETRAELPNNDAIFEFMQKDKKKLLGKLKFVLPTEIGDVIQTTDVTREEIYAAFEYIERV